MRINTRTAAAVAAAALCAGVLAGCSDSGSGSASKEEAADFVAASPSTSPPSSMTSSPSVNPSEEVGKVSVKTGPFGKILVNGKGHTLYLFEADKAKKSTCSGDCVVDWPPALVKGTPQAGTGVKANLLTTTTRSDGTKQAMYNGHPLYTFREDTKPGETKGQDLTEFGAKWFVVSPEGKAITTPPQSASPTSSTSPSESASSSASPSAS
ncbi:hypothetical protein [Streptomyces scopuliridis]|uniref:Lipoprotein n=1 Tax=Streptomyces scopuliridis RB72 TaxID=1440053 RepID=A0A2T7TCJ7_9ACTN|nr:hypothetical protein [Streptomyces scopuliridis]PVE12863.1 hypothetical protein Y717_26915 [Streptomyces scopuliridis RB72]